ncbi:Protein of unknown function [Sphingomonas guangdongensis]|uniref:DUF2793 domain-containing protein n=1 Tax=Sphingomonas guangdongensis TaxID=1141890 RepID=A0A285QI83_9SPHN|nr:DUF2793 domain-containing protein [Sphingomonas guangdongensis]SOB81194.1 Protein of unknown function [Sphingomonas guangdongensis]
MTEETARWALPMIVPGQAQKEMTHNEALARLDLMVAATVETAPLDTPPRAPVPGTCWIVGAAPTAAWSGQAHALAGWTSGGWRFVQPREGMQLWIRDEGHSLRFLDGAWAAEPLSGGSLAIAGESILGPRAPAIAAPSGGMLIDEQCRATLLTIIEVLQHHRLIA